MTETEAELEHEEELELEHEQEHFRELAHHPEELAMLPGELRPHPKPAQYVLIAVILVVVTALEVGASYLDGDINSNLLIALLLVMAAVKFVLVVSWYMHLRTDIRFFSRVFTLGCVAALVIYMVMLLSFSVFD